MPVAYIGLGSNLGDKAASLRAAIEALGRHPQLRVVAVSPFYRSEAWGKTDQDWFVNAAARLETDLQPLEILDVLLATEKELGRVRHEHWGARIIDLDLLLYDDIQMKTERLTLPHPYITERAFVLRPLLDLAPELKDPVTGKNYNAALDALGEAGNLLRSQEQEP